MKLKFLLIILCFSLVSTWLALTGCTSAYKRTNYPNSHPANPIVSEKQPIENSGLHEADPIESQMTERLKNSPDSDKAHQHHEGSHHEGSQSR